jgi:hypothetical protein
MFTILSGYVFCCGARWENVPIWRNLALFGIFQGVDLLVLGLFSGKGLFSPFFYAKFLLVLLVLAGFGDCFGVVSGFWRVFIG